MSRLKKVIALTLSTAIIATSADATNVVLIKASETGEINTEALLSASDDFAIYEGELMEYLGAGGEVVIPEGVTSIGASAFRNCTTIESVVIPEGVTSIGETAFYGCSNLKSIKFPADLTSIGEEAFDECSNLKTIEFSNNITSIGADAFTGTKWLNERQAENPLVNVNGILVDGKKCSGDVEIPMGITSIGDRAFSKCVDLTSVELPEGITSIGNSAFNYCRFLSSINLPKGITNIGNRAFASCSNLGSIELPEGITSIGDSAFYECSNLRSMILPEGVTSIGNSTFGHCSNLSNIKLSKKLTSIGEYAFWMCSSLRSIELPEGVINIGENSFSACTKLNILCKEGSYAETYAKQQGIPYQIYTATPTSSTMVTATVSPTVTLALTATPKPTATPEATATSKPTATPEPTETQKLTATPKPTTMPEATATPRPTATPEPTETQKLTATRKPTTMPEATATPRPTATPEPTVPDTEYDNGLIQGGDSLENAVEVELGKEYTTLGKEYTTLGKDGWYKITTPDVVSAIVLGYDGESSVEAYDEDGNKLCYLGYNARGYWDNLYEYYDIYALGEKTSAWTTDVNGDMLKGNTAYYFYISTDSPTYSRFQILCEERYTKSEKAKVIETNTEYSCRFLVSDDSSYKKFKSYYKFVAPTTGKYKLCLNTIGGGAEAAVYQEGYNASDYISTKSNIKTREQQVDKYIELIAGKTYYMQVQPLTTGVTATIQIANKKVETISLNQSEVILEQGQAYAIQPTISPQDAIVQEVTYKTRNPKVAIVNEEGYVTTVGAGTTSIICMATDGSNVSAECKVTVKPLVGEDIPDDLEDGLIEGGDSLENAAEVEIGKEYTTLGKNGWYKITTPDVVSTILLGYDNESNVEAYDEDGNKLCYLGYNASGYWDNLYEYYAKYALGEETSAWTTDINGDELRGNTAYYFYISTDGPTYSRFQILCEERYAKSEKAKVIENNEEYSCRFLAFDSSSYKRIKSYYKFVVPTTGEYKLSLYTVDGGTTAVIYQEDNNPYSSDLISISTNSNITKGQYIAQSVELTAGQTYYVQVTPLTAGVTATIKVWDNKTQPTTVVSPTEIVKSAITEQPTGIVEPDVTVKPTEIAEPIVTVKPTEVAKPTPMAALNKKIQTIQISYRDYMYKGDSFQIKTTVYPADVDNKSINYTSSNTKVATVSANGLVTAKAAGRTRITCKATDGSNVFADFDLVVVNMLKTGTKVTIGDIQYKVTAGIDKYDKCEVSVLKVKTKAKKSYTIPDTVKINGYTCKFIGIDASAFSGCTKATKITVGKNVQKIGSKAFYNCKNLRTLTINSTKVKSVGTKVFKNVYAKAKIKVPSSKLKSYQKLFAKKGQKSTVKITKK